MVVASIECPWGGQLEFREHSSLDYTMYQVFGAGDDKMEQYVGMMRVHTAKLWFKTVEIAKKHRKNLKNRESLVV